MKGENDILSKHIRERLKDFEQPVPDRLWASIEEDLNYSVNISRKRILWQRLSIAASFLLVLALGTLFFLNYEERKSMLTDNKTETIETPELKSNPMLLAEKNDPAVNNPETDNKLKQPGVYTFEKHTYHTKKIKTEEITNTTEEATGIYSEYSSESEEKKPKEEKPEPTRQNRKSSSFYEDAKTADNNLWHNVSGKKRKNNRISYALAFGNSSNFKSEVQQLNSRGYNDSQHSPGSYVLSSPVVSFDPIDLTKRELIYNATNDPTSASADYDYDFPVSVSFTVRKQFSDVFALETGLVYTYLSSKGTITTTPVITNNTSLNYLGIPVKAVYSFFNNDRFSVYASAGGMVEKSIAGKFKTNTNGKIETEDLNIKELQWSVSGAIGINYQLIGRLSLFVEPGAGYYFDDGNDVMTIRENRPLSFTLQGGLRLTY